MSGQHVDYQTTEQCWNNALTFLQYLNSSHFAAENILWEHQSVKKIGGNTQMTYKYLYVEELRGIAKHFQPRFKDHMAIHC